MWGISNYRFHRANFNNGNIYYSPSKEWYFRSVCQQYVCRLKEKGLLLIKVKTEIVLLWDRNVFSKTEACLTTNIPAHILLLTYLNYSQQVTYRLEIQGVLILSLLLYNSCGCVIKIWLIVQPKLIRHKIGLWPLQSHTNFKRWKDNIVTYCYYQRQHIWSLLHHVTLTLLQHLSSTSKHELAFFCDSLSRPVFDLCALVGTLCSRLEKEVRRHRQHLSAGASRPTDRPDIFREKNSKWQSNMNSVQL